MQDIKREIKQHQNETEQEERELRELGFFVWRLEQQTRAIRFFGYSVRAHELGRAIWDICSDQVFADFLSGINISRDRVFRLVVGTEDVEMHGPNFVADCQAINDAHQTFYLSKDERAAYARLLEFGWKQRYGMDHSRLSTLSQSNLIVCPSKLFITSLNVHCSY